jgi:hypothetical protein
LVSIPELKKPALDNARRESKLVAKTIYDKGLSLYLQRFFSAKPTS